MPSIFTLEGPKLGCTSCTGVPGPIGAVAMPAKGKLVLFAIGGAALLGVAWHFMRYPRGGRRLGLVREGLRLGLVREGLRLRGPSMLRVIASESRTADEFARRAEAWNAAEADPLPVTKLAKAFKKAKPGTVARLIREAEYNRTEGRERMWSKMSRGLRAYMPREGRNPRLFGLGALDITAKQQAAFKRGVGAMRRAMKGTNDPERAFGIAIKGSKDPDFAAGVRTAFNLASEKGNRDAAQTNLVKYGFKTLGATRITLGPRGRQL